MKECDEGNESVKYCDVTFYHMPEELVRDFKEYCRVHAGNKFGLGLSQLLFVFKDKQTYYGLLERVARLEEQVTSLLAKSVEVEDEPMVIKTFGGEIKLNGR